MLLRPHPDAAKCGPEARRRFDDSSVRRSLGVTEAPGLSNAELARRSFVTPQTMIRIVAGLEDKGLVTRVEHPSHGRILEVSLTAAGEKTVNSCHQRVKRVEHRMEGDLSETEGRTLADLLERCAVALGESGRSDRCPPVISSSGI
jgi:DNA-binding MarR family transcriptional regulator